MKLETHESVPVTELIAIGQVSVPVQKFDFWTLVLHLLFEKLLKLRRCRMNYSPFWARVGSGGFAFREPFADLSRTFRGFLA